MKRNKRILLSSILLLASAQVFAGKDNPCSVGCTQQIVNKAVKEAITPLVVGTSVGPGAVIGSNASIPGCPFLIVQDTDVLNQFWSGPVPSPVVDGTFSQSDGLSNSVNADVNGDTLGALGVCATLNRGPDADPDVTWYLPSVTEMWCLGQNAATLNVNGIYWTSSVVSADPKKSAYCYAPTDGKNLRISTEKTAEHRVRCVRQ